MKTHIKGFILQMLAAQPQLWDTELTSLLCKEYHNPDNDYWLGTVRISLTELSTNGLVIVEDEYWHAQKEKLLFKYRLSEFGLKRMYQTGLIPIYSKDKNVKKYQK